MANKKFITKAEAGQVLKFLGLQITEFDLVYKDYGLHLVKVTNADEIVSIHKTKYPDVVYVDFEGIDQYENAQYIFKSHLTWGDKKFWNYKELVHDKNGLWRLIDYVAGIGNCYDLEP